ncbi:MAG: hypothetical protein EPO16_05555 [Dehalococcoidia bacterium]|nr:MAG: hypothetical protein EPO16_05555 [Dehalococcoidia bacterium]
MALLITGCATGAGRGSPRAESELRFHWVVPEGFTAAVSLYRALDVQPTGETRTYPPGASVQLGDALGDGVLRGRLDESQRLVLKIENQGPEPLRFWVAPHLPLPHEGEVALMAQCLCTGAVYEVPAAGSWTRVIEFGIRRRGAVTPLSVTHVIVLGEAPRLWPSGQSN